MKGVLGIDEAGKGPIVGPLVMCAVLVHDEATFKQIGVKDSKLLSPKQRDELYPEVCDFSERFVVEKIPTHEIDEAVAGNNLNWLEADYTVKMIDELEPAKAIVDCPMRNTEVYRQYILERLKVKCELICENKADARYDVVAAASIIAKVERDKEVEKLKRDLNYDFGSGYLSDPKTQKFLKEKWMDFPKVFRQSWAPYKAIRFAKNQKSLGEF